MTILAWALAMAIYLITGELLLLLIDSTNTLYQDVAGRFKNRLLGEVVASFGWPALCGIAIYRRVKGGW